MPHLYYITKNICTLFLAVKPFAIKEVFKTLSPLSNFIQKYKGETLEILPWILEIAFRLLKVKQKVAVCGCKILISILENYKFLLDSYLPSILSEICAAFAAQSKEVKIYCSQATNLALWNSTLLTLSTEPLISSALRFSLANIRKYKDSIARSHMISGFGSLFYVIPQLPQHIFGILPTIFKAILRLCKDTHEHSSLGSEELCDHLDVLINYDAQYQETIKESLSFELDDNTDIERCFLLDGNRNFYDSSFINVDRIMLIKDIVQNLVWNYPKVMDSINILLTKKEVELLNSIVTTI